ncbi:hypothetical protein C9374_003423 [Naegleria lovaniensis]|uniref:ubiquitinyl hydrolase 1 n=1 Tax=Naegleria lovaniensis TaxID=51637 RepID=A0AA88GST3_NAELO|nr:uncharacterized protein C9374_003423 [Naegleria lovaniensis]KAG2385608.1 hypothetical protein C9374_003423 [Naegleria lovaniensis]
MTTSDEQADPLLPATTQQEITTAVENNSHPMAHDLCPMDQHDERHDHTPTTDDDNDRCSSVATVGSASTNHDDNDDEKWSDTNEKDETIEKEVQPSNVPQQQQSEDILNGSNKTTNDHSQLSTTTAEAANGDNINIVEMISSLKPDPEDLIRMEFGFDTKYRRISDLYKELMAKYSDHSQQIIEILDGEISMLKFIRVHYADSFDEFVFSDFKYTNSHWFLHTHMVAILNLSTSLKEIDHSDILLKLGQLITTSIEFYLEIMVQRPFSLLETMTNEDNQSDQKSGSTTSSSDKLDDTIPTTVSQELENIRQQKLNHISKCVSFGVDVCRSLTNQKHELYLRNLLYSRDVKLFNHENSVFIEQSQKFPQSSWNEDFKNCIFSTPRSKSELLSKLCCKSINIFGQSGGYVLFINLLRKYKDLPMRIIEKIIDTIAFQTPYLVPKCRESIITALIDSLFVFFDMLSDEILKVEERFKDLILNFRNKILSCYTDEKCIDIFDRLKLQYFYRLLNCSSVERKMLGMNEIRVHVESLRKTETGSKTNSPQLNGNDQQPHSSPQPQPISFKKELHVKTFLSWVNEKKFLHYLFETDVHRELLRQATVILQFLAQYKGFTKEELDLIWQASVDKHEATQRLILSIISLLIPSLSYNDILHLYSKVELIPIESINKKDHFIEFLSQFTIYAVSSSYGRGTKDKKKNWFALDMLWKLAIGGNRKAFECLSDVFKQDAFEAIRKDYLKSCIEMLKNRNNSSGAVSLMKTLLATYSLQKKKKKLSTWGIISSINEKTHLMDHFFSNYENQFPTDMENNDQNDQELRDQLDFLEFVVKNSPIRLSFKQCIVLWSHGRKEIVVGWLTKMRDNFVEEFQAFDDETTMLVFEELICSPSKDNAVLYANMTEKELDCFLMFFLSINVILKKIDVVYENQSHVDNTTTILDQQSSNGGKKLISKIVAKGKEFLDPTVPYPENEQEVPIVRKLKKFEVIAEDLHGINHLWNIVLSAKDTNVLRKATESLNNFRTDYSKDLKSSTASFMEKHVSTCMELLQLYSKPDQRNDSYLGNIITVLLDFIVLVNQKSGGGGIGKGHGISFLGYPITLNINCFSNLRFVKMVPSKMKVGALLNIIASELGDETSSQLLRLETESGDDITPFKAKSLEELGMDSRVDLFVKPLTIKDASISIMNTTMQMLGVPELGALLVSRNRSLPQKKVLQKNSENGFPLTSISNHDTDIDDDYVILDLEDGLYPANVLSRENNFYLLFSLLDTSHEEVAKKAWMLLMHLPTNQIMSKNILNIENSSKVDWGSVLPINNSHKLLYSLQILDTKFQKKLTQESTFYHSFIKLGGVSHLIDGLLASNTQTENKSPLHKQCMALLLKLLNKFIPNYEERLPNILECLLRAIGMILSDEHTEENNSLPSLLYRQTPDIFQFNPSFTMTQEYANFMLYDYSLTSIQKIVAAKGDLMTMFLKHEDLSRITMRSLLYTADANIRKKFLNTVIEIASHNEAACKYFIDILYRMLKEENIEKYQDRCEQYFSLLENLIGSRPNNFTEIKEDDIHVLIEKIINRNVVEESHSSQPDYILIGLFNITRALLKIYPYVKQTLEETGKRIFYSCLFEVPKSRTSLQIPKCKTRESRDAAFQFLSELADNSPTIFSELLSLLEKYMHECEQPTFWNIVPRHLERKKPFVGLKNQGATCYMNSLIQQFFMTIPFRKELLRVNTDTTSAVEEKMQDNVNLLKELQSIFAFLQESSKKFYDTRPFCSLYKVDGRPVDCSTQHDANEFFNLFTDRIEEALKFYGKGHLLKDVFGGTLLHQIIYDDNVSERPENFNIISLEVKNKRNIMESLDLYVQGEMLEGNNQYYSDKLEKHVDALKRTLIKDLPNVLILHLKRFDFDFSLMVNRKINDRVEFPHTLNMEPYTVEGMERKEQRGIYDIPPAHRQDDYYQYKLVGVLVHSGSADSGHYYSFIMNRGSTNEEETWYEFNDEEINLFDTDNLDSECFGGIVENNINGRKTSMFRCNNAYMLFYQRVHLLHADTFSSNSETCNQQHDTILDIPASIKEKVWKENERFYHYKNIFDDSFDTFLFSSISTLQTNEHELLTKNISLTLTYILEFYIHSSNPKIMKWIMYLKDIFEKNPTLCKTFLKSLSSNKQNWLIPTIVTCPSQEIKDLIIDLFISCIKSLYPHENLIEYLDNTNQMDVSIDNQCCIGIFIDTMIGMMGMYTTWRSATHYFRFLYELASFAPYNMRLFLIKRQLISKMILYMMGLNPEGQYDQVSFSSLKQPLITMSSQLSLSYMIVAIAFLVKTCDDAKIANKPTSLNYDLSTPISETTERHVFSLPKADFDKLFNKAFLTSLMSLNLRLDDIAGIFAHYCWEDADFTKSLVNHLLQCTFQNAVNEASDPFIVILETMLLINDSLQAQRVKLILDAYFTKVEQITDARVLLYCLKHLTRTDRKNDYCTEWWDNHMDAILKITSKHGWTLNRKR